MARNATMIPMASGGTGRRLLAVLVAMVLLALVLRDPVGAAHAVQRLAGWAGDVIDALARFSAALAGS